MRITYTRSSWMGFIAAAILLGLALPMIGIALAKSPPMMSGRVEEPYVAPLGYSGAALFGLHYLTDVAAFILALVAHIRREPGSSKHAAILSGLALLSPLLLLGVIALTAKL